MTVLGIDANNTDLVFAAVPEHPDGLPGRLKPAAFDASGLADLGRRLVEHFGAHTVSVVAIVSDLSSRTAPRSLKPRIQLETVAMTAAHHAGATVAEITLGAAMSHLNIASRKGQSKRSLLRSTLEDSLGSDRLAPAPERRASALGVALAAADLSLADM